MSTAEQIAVMQAHVEGKRIEFTCPPDGTDWLTLEPNLTPSWNWESYTYRVAEERPREWELAISRGDGSARVVEPGESTPSKLAWETVRVTELPDGWEVRRKEEPDGWRYFKMHLHSWKSDGVTTLYKGGGDWVDSVSTLEELLGEKRITETDAAGRPVEKP